MPIARSRAARAVLAAALLPIAACANPNRPGPRRPAPLAAPAPAGASSVVLSGASSELEYLRERRLMVPVDGVRPDELRDSFDAGRSGGRRHNALDILAPRGTPVLAVDDGRILRIGENRAGGLTIYLVDDEERFVYYYAHLDRYRARLAEGERIVQGEVLGYVGTTGNAPENIPHLHFQLMRYDDPRRWWDGTPVNPYGLLVREGHRTRE